MRILNIFSVGVFDVFNFDLKLGDLRFSGLQEGSPLRLLSYQVLASEVLSLTLFAKSDLSLLMLAVLSLEVRDVFLKLRNLSSELA